MPTKTDTTFNRIGRGELTDVFTLLDPKDYPFAFERALPICPMCFGDLKRPSDVPKTSLPVAVTCCGVTFKAIFYYRQWAPQ